VNAWTGNLEAARRHAQVLKSSSARHSLLYWYWWGKCHEFGLNWVDRDDFPDGDWRQQLPDVVFTPLHLENLATYRTELCHELVAQWVKDGQSGWCAPEVLRASGETALRKDKVNGIGTAEGLFRQAIDLARQQGALPGSCALSSAWQSSGIGKAKSVTHASCWLRPMIVSLKDLKPPI
jgi:hypothetical protein